MPTKLARAGSISVALLTSSCAALWGFDDPSVPTDAAAPNDASDTREGGTLDAAARVDPVDGSSEMKHPSLEMDAGTKPIVMDGGQPSPSGHDAAVPNCPGPCGMGGTCRTAVGNVAVCITATLCTDGSECGLAGCCVWLDDSSATGQCESVGVPSAVSCLCTGKAKGMDMARCKSCGPPANASVGVMVCSQ